MTPENLNSGHHTCVASTSPAEPAPIPRRHSFTDHLVSAWLAVALRDGSKAYGISETASVGEAYSKQADVCTMEATETTK